MDLSWLTDAGSPWVATIGAPILTLVLTQKHARRTGESERKASGEALRLQLDSEMERLRISAESEAERARAETLRGEFAAALDAIAALEGAIVVSTLEPIYEPTEESGPVPVREELAKPVDPLFLGNFAAAINRLRLYEADDRLEVDELTHRVAEYISYWGFNREIGMTPAVTALVAELRGLAATIGEIYRAKHLTG